MKVLVTGVAGFIGYHVAQRLMLQGHEVVGIDNLNAFYDVRLKQAKIDRLYQSPSSFSFIRLDVAEHEAIRNLFDHARFDAVIHLAAQAGVRHSLTHPHAYVDANITGFLNVLEGCRHAGIQHLVYASSSSVYGGNDQLPFSVSDPVDRPVSLYAATKRSNELMAQTYSHLYRIPATGLRFFTVYGPWNRPDMAMFLFTESIVQGRPIHLFNAGQSQRDLTYVDDVVEAIVRVLATVPGTNQGSELNLAGNTGVAHCIHNVGSQRPVLVTELVEMLEEVIGLKAQRVLYDAQPGDVDSTLADTSSLTRAVGSWSTMDLEEGIRRFVEWYQTDYVQIVGSPSLALLATD